MESTAGKEKVKKAKHIMEKRRRARINASLAELKCLLPGAKGREGSRSIKMEKADILERAVEHLKLLQEIYQCGETPRCCGHHPATNSHSNTSYDQGYQECLDDVDNYLVRMRMDDTEMRAQVMSHIASKKARFKYGQITRSRLCNAVKLKRCGALSKGGGKTAMEKKKVAKLLSNSCQHTHSPADSTTPEDDGLDEELVDASSDDMTAAKDDDDRCCEDTDGTRTEDKTGGVCKENDKSCLTSYSHNLEGDVAEIQRKIKQEVQKYKDDRQDSSCHNCAREPRLGNNSSSSNNNNNNNNNSGNNRNVSNDKKNTSSSSESSHNLCVSKIALSASRSSNCDTDNESSDRNTHDSFFLNPHKASSLVIITNRRDCARKAGSKQTIVDANQSSFPFHRSHEVVPGNAASNGNRKNLLTPVSKKPVDYSPASLPKPKQSAFADQLPNQQRGPIILPTPVCEQLSIMIPSAASKSKPADQTPFSNHSHDQSENDVTWHARRHLDQPFPLLLMTSHDASKRGSNSSSTIYPRSDRSNLLVSQLIKPLKDNLGGSLNKRRYGSVFVPEEEEEQAYDLSMKTKARGSGRDSVQDLEKRLQHVHDGEEVDNHPSFDGQEGGDSCVWRPW